MNQPYRATYDSNEMPDMPHMDTIHMQRNPDVPQPKMTPEREYINEEDIDLSYTRRKKMEEAEQAAKDAGGQGGEQAEDGGSTRGESAEKNGRTTGEQNQQPVAEQPVAPEKKKSDRSTAKQPVAAADRRGSTWC